MATLGFPKNAESELRAMMLDQMKEPVGALTPYDKFASAGNIAEGDSDTNAPKNEGMKEVSNDRNRDISNEKIIIPANEASTETLRAPSKRPSNTTRKVSSNVAARVPIKAGTRASTEENLQAASQPSSRRSAFEDVLASLQSASGGGRQARLNVDIDEDLHQRVKEHCTRKRIKIKQLIPALLEAYLAESED